MEAELGHVDDNGWTFKSMRGPPPSLERQFELLHPLRERGIQRPECSGIQDSCCFQPVSPLKPPDSFGEAVIIDRRFWRCAPGIQVTYKLQPLEQAPRADVSISRCNFTLRRRQCLPVVVASQCAVPIQRSECSLVSRERWLKFLQLLANAAAGRKQRKKKVRRVFSSISGVQLEVKEPRTHSTRVQVRNISHRGDGQRHVEVDQVRLANFCVRRNPFEPLRPLPPVVILCSQSFFFSSLKNLNHGPRIFRRLASRQPRQRIVRCLVEFLNLTLRFSKEGW